MAVETYTFTTGGNYTYGANIEVTGGVAQLVLNSVTGQTFNEDFSSTTGFTYNASNTDFNSGRVEQEAQTYQGDYTEGTFYASYASSIDADSGFGTLTGTATGGAAVSGGKLDLTGGGVKYVDYAGAENASTSPLTGCIRIKFTPNYNTAPAASCSLFCICQANGNWANQIQIRHLSGAGLIDLNIRDSAGTSIINTSIGVFTPTLGQEYEFELNYDVANGATRLFIDGVQLGATQGATGSRNSTIGLIRIGSNESGATAIDGSFDDFIIFNTPQNTVGFTPAAYPQTLNPTFYASYQDGIKDANWGDGTLTSTSTGGAASDGTHLDLSYNDTRYLDYSATSNTDSQQVGCVRFRVTPNYTGSPAVNQNYTFICEADGTINNLFSVQHASSGNLIIVLYNSAGVPILASGLGAWSPTSGTEYEFEANFDITNGQTRLFVDGTQFGATQTATGTRSSAIALLRVGSNHTATLTSNFKIRDITYYSNIQHSTNYTPDWSGILPYQYNTDTITLPAMTYSGAGNIQAFTAINITAGNAPRYIVNGMYAPPTRFFANYNDNVDGDEGFGTLTGSAAGGAGAAGGKLDLKYSDLRYVDYDADLNADIQQKGCIRLLVTPNYTGAPVANQCFFSISKATGDSDNLIQLTHTTGGQLNLNIKDSGGVDIISGDIGAWSPTASTEYEIEVGFDIDDGKTMLFVDGTQLGSTQTGEGTRDASIALLRIGSDVNASLNSNFEIDDFAFFAEPQHTANYTAGAYNAYYATSSDTWITASDYTYLSPYIDNFPVADTITIKVITQNNVGSQQYVDDLTLTYTGQGYDQTEPTIYPNSTVNSEGVTSLAETIVTAGLDAVKYVLMIGGIDYYWNGSSWAVSTGYAQSNTAAEITTNAASLTISGQSLRPKAYLHSDNGSTTPQLDQLVLTYDLKGPSPTTPNENVVFGYLYDGNGDPINNAIVSAQLGGDYVYNSEIVMSRTSVDTRTDTTGYWELSLVENANMTAGAYWTFIFMGDGINQTSNRVVPDAVSSNYASLSAP